MQKTKTNDTAPGMLESVMLTALALFMGALAVGIVSTPMQMEPALALTLKAFIALTLGGIAVGCLVGLFGGRRAALVELPPEVIARCFTCGELGPRDVVCSHCGEPPDDRASMVEVASTTVVTEAIVAAILAGVFCLGGFVLIGPVLEGERRVWALLAFFGLGLLLLAVGSVGMAGFALVLKDRLRGVHTISFGGGNSQRYARGTGRLASGDVVWLQGYGEVAVPLTAEPHEGATEATAENRALAQAIATFGAAGFIVLRNRTGYTWRFGDAAAKHADTTPDFQRDTLRHVVVFPYHEPDDRSDEDAGQSSDINNDGALDRNVRRFIGQFVDVPQELPVLVNRLLADPVGRDQFEQHAETIREHGVVVSAELKRAVLVAMLDSQL